MPANEQGWHPDPAGRHQYRWWDGSSWTDQVADGDVTSTDPLAGGAAADPAAGSHDPSGAGTAGAAAGGAAAGAAVGAAAAGTPPAEATPPPTEVTPTPQQAAAAQPPAPTSVAPQPVAAQPTPPGGGAPSGGAPAPSGGSDKSKLPLIIGGVVAVVVVAAAAFFLLGGDSESDGTGEFTATIEGDDGVFSTDIVAEPGDAFGVTVETTAVSNLRGGSSDLDAVLIIAAADAETADAINEFESDELGADDPEGEHDALADQIDENTNVRVEGEAFGIRDDQGAGEDEALGITFPVAGTFTVSVAGFEDTEGAITVTIAKQSTDEDLGDNPSADEIDDLTTGEHADFLAGFTDDPVIYADLAARNEDPDPVDDPVEDPDPVDDPVADPVEDPDPVPDPGVDLEAEAIDLLTTELVTSAGLSEADAACVSTNIIDTIGVDGLAEIGLAAGAGGDITSLSPEQQDDLFALIQGAFDVCGVLAN